MKQHRIHKTEDGSVCANAEGKCYNGNQRESRTLEKSSESVAKIFEQRFHNPSYSYLSATSGSTLIALLLACRQTPPAQSGGDGDPCESADACKSGYYCYEGSCTPDGEGYEGIRKDRVNVSGRLTLADASGPFGNPTSDSARTMVTVETTSVLFVIYAPAGSGAAERERAAALTTARVEAYARASVGGPRPTC